MNISKYEQRALHTLAQGGEIQFRREKSRVVEANCFSREGYLLEDFSLSLFKQLLRRGFIRSQNGKPYRITQLGRQSVRAQINNR
ncbi:YjhX family toxin [bacterium]|nr:YjhX family toxin [bacterium]